jgi:hypothetical protein
VLQRTPILRLTGMLRCTVSSTVLYALADDKVARWAVLISAASDRAGTAPYLSCRPHTYAESPERHRLDLPCLSPTQRNR